MVFKFLDYLYYLDISASNLLFIFSIYLALVNIKSGRV